MPERRIAFLGLGDMGQPMARNVLKTGYPLTVWNRNPHRTIDLERLGARVAASPHDAASEADVVITMLTDAAVVESIALGEDGVVSGLRPGATYIDMSTVTPATSRRLAAAAQQQGAGFLEAPVVGSIGPAAEGTLTIFVGGDERLYEAHRDLLACMGSTIVYAGAAGQGTWLKLLVNALLGTTMQALFEVLALGQRVGFSRQFLIDTISGTPVASVAMQRKGQAWLTRDFSPQFPLDLMHKDFRQTLEAAGEEAVPLPLASLAYGLFTQARSGDRGALDYSVASQLFEELAGLRTATENNDEWRSKEQR